MLWRRSQVHRNSLGVILNKLKCLSRSCRSFCTKNNNDNDPSKSENESSAELPNLTNSIEDTLHFFCGYDEIYRSSWAARNIYNKITYTQGKVMVPFIFGNSISEFEKDFLDGCSGAADYVGNSLLDEVVYNANACQPCMENELHRKMFNSLDALKLNNHKWRFEVLATTAGRLDRLVLLRGAGRGEIQRGRYMSGVFHQHFILPKDPRDLPISERIRLVAESQSSGMLFIADAFVRLRQIGWIKDENGNLVGGSEEEEEKWHLLRFELSVRKRNPQITFSPKDRPHSDADGMEDPIYEQEDGWHLVDWNEALHGNYPIKMDAVKSPPGTSLNELRGRLWSNEERENAKKMSWKRGGNNFHVSVIFEKKPKDQERDVADNSEAKGKIFSSKYDTDATEDISNKKKDITTKEEELDKKQNIKINIEGDLFASKYDSDGSGPSKGSGKVETGEGSETLPQSGKNALDEGDMFSSKYDAGSKVSETNETNSPNKDENKTVEDSDKTNSLEEGGNKTKEEPKAKKKRGKKE